ncbi:MAG: hypothetical protein QW076_02430 [Candidatus Anstonellales archaeon]
MFVKITKISSNNYWSPTEEGEELVGVLKNVLYNQGPRKNSTLYQIETDEGIKQVWGSLILDDLLKEVAIGTLIKIVYKGKSTSAHGVEFKKWEVYKDEDTSQTSQEENFPDFSDDEILSSN